MSLSLKVEVAFNAGYATASGSRTWTDISSYVELQDGLDISFARRDEFSSADANTLSLTLDNSDGRFTPERSSSPYYPNVKLYRPIRVTATLPDSSTSVRFLGYVTQWPTEWQGGEDGYAKSTLTASSRISRLGQTTQLRTMLAEDAVALGARSQYSFTEAEGATYAADGAGQGAPPLLIVASYLGNDPVVFGSVAGPGFDEVTAVTFTPTSKNLANSVAGAFYTGGMSWDVWFRAESIPSGFYSSFGILQVDGRDLYINTAGQVASGSNPLGTIALGTWYHAAATYDGLLEKTYLNGALVYSGTDHNVIYTAILNEIGGQFDGSISHVATYPFALTAAQVASLYAGGTANESTAARLQRIAGFGKVPTAEVSSTGAVVVGPQPVAGKTVIEALRQVESTEGGVLYDERDGTLTLATRSARYNATSAFTLDASSQHIGSDFKPTYDETGLLNDVAATSLTTAARYTAASSIADYGQASTSIETLAVNADEPIMLAGWLVNAHDQPTTRVGTLTVDVLPFASGTPSVMNLAAATVGTMLTVSNLPSQATASSATYFVEGYTEKFNVESWVITFNVSNTAPYLNIWVLDSGTRSQLDSTTIPAL